MDLNLVRKALGELIGTFTFIFLGCGILMMPERYGVPIPEMAAPIVFGFAISAMIYALGHISGAHFNPAVTIAFAVARHFHFKQVVWYVCAQVLGATAAIALLCCLMPEGLQFGATTPSVGIWQSFVWEMLLTFFLMFVIMAVATDTRAVGIMAGVAIGSIVMIAAFVGGPMSGASMNPARSFAPALFQGTLDTYWIYLIAPILGSVSAACLYEWIRCHDQSDSDKAAGGCC